MENDIAQKIIAKLNDDPSLLPIFENILQDPLFINIVKEISSINDEVHPLGNAITKREDILSNIERFAQCSKVSDRVNDEDQNGNSKQPTQFIPDLVHGQLIKVKFTGAGSEIEEDHYAIVWEAKPKRDQVIVVPTNSFKPTTREYKHNFNIGKVFPFNKETLVCIDQITCISRKRIIEYTFYNPVLRRNNISIIEPNQKNRIFDGIRATWFNAPILLDYLLNNSHKYIPIFSNFDQQITHLFRPYESIKYDNSKLETYYKLYNDGIWYKVSWEKSSISPSNRNKLIRSLAYARQENNSGVLITREKMKEDSYNELKNARIVDL